MTRHQARTLLGVGLVCAHILMLGLLLVFYLLSGFTFQEMTTTMQLIGPVFVAYVTVVLRWFLASGRRRGSGRKASGTYLFFTLVPPCSFVLFLLVLIWAKAVNWLEDFSVFKALLALGETTFAAYLGVLMESLFNES